MSGKKTFVCLLAGVVLSAAGATESFGYLPVGVLMISIVGSIISALVGLFSKNFATARVFGLLVLLSLFAIMLGFGFSQRRQDTTQQAAGPVIAAIERYQSAHGALPASLDQLVPEQLAQVPAANARPFWYHVASNDFQLSFPIPAMMVRRYDSKTKKWSTHD